MLEAVFMYLYSAVSKQGESAPRTGFFHFFKRQEVTANDWQLFCIASFFVLGSSVEVGL